MKYANNMGKKFEKQYFIITPILSAIFKKIGEILEILDKMGAHFREFTVTTNIFQSAHPPWSLWRTPKRNFSKIRKKNFFTKNFSKSTWAREYCRKFYKSLWARELGEFAVSGWLETLSGGHVACPKSIDVRRAEYGCTREAGRRGEASLTGLA